MTPLSPWDREWPAVVARLLPELPAVDQEPLAVWLSIYPLLLLDLTPDPAAETFFQMKGNWRLAGQENISHSFLYAHAWWGAAQAALRDFSPPPGSLEAALRALAARIEAPPEHRLTLAILALMTLRQAGPAFLATPLPTHTPARGVAQVLAARTASSGGLLAGLFGKPKKFTVRFDERDTAKSFPILASQEITTAAEADKRPYHLADPRCYEGMGPIPVDCRSGSCGTCWVGVLAGRENLEALTDFERQRMTYFGYWDSGFSEENTPHPRVRLACQAKAFGNVTLVIPPWNGVFGKVRRDKERRPPPEAT